MDMREMTMKKSELTIIVNEKNRML